MDEFIDTVVSLSQVFVGVVVGGVAAAGGYLVWRISRDARAVVESVHWLEGMRLFYTIDGSPSRPPAHRDFFRSRQNLGRVSARLLNQLAASGRLHQATVGALLETSAAFDIAPRELALASPGVDGSPFETVEGVLRFVAAFDATMAAGRPVPLSQEDIRHWAFVHWAHQEQAEPEERRWWDRPR
jgi:hypothetical protein